MAISGLNLPTDIPWERVCVTTDMIDPGGTAPPPPLWQSSMALYRYVPPAEFQLYPGRRILYYKLAATISNYQPKADEVLGTLNSGALSTGTLTDEEVKRRLAESLPCSAAIVQVSVTPRETDKPLQDFPYFLDVQPRQRALYEQVTETQERASRSLETLQLRKDAGSSNSIEVLDVDQGGTVQGGYGGFSAGLTRAGQWGTKSLGKEDNTNVTTTDASRESRETLAFTTQLSQMYTLLQAYHLGTNRVFFYITPRPHAVEPPTGIAGPRKLDGVQDLFLIVSQAEGDALPCITARLDTGHLTIRPKYDFDTSQPSKTLTLTCDAPAPLENDPQGIGTTLGESAFYACWSKSVTRQAEIDAPTGYVVAGTVDLVNTAVGNSSFTNSSTVTLLPNPMQATKVVIDATATGYACHRNTAGDLANFALHPSGGATGTPLWPETWTSQPGLVTRSVSVSFRSQVANVKVGDEYVLALTTRQLQCCDNVKIVPPKLVEYVPVHYVPATIVTGVNEPLPTVASPVPPPLAPPAPVGVPTTAAKPDGKATTPARRDGTLTLATVNDLQQRLGAETLRLSTQLANADAAPARDSEFVLNAVLPVVLDDPRRQKGLRAGAGTLGLGPKELDRLATALGRTADTLNRFDVLTAPNQLIKAATGRSGAALVRLRLEAAGLPTTAPAEPKVTVVVARPARAMAKRKSTSARRKT